MAARRPLRDRGAMTENITSEPAVKRLERSRSDRMLAGVCGGLARYFDLNPAFYRVGFVVLTLLGGAGILIYIAAALVIPEEGKADSIAAEALRERRERPWQVIGLGLVAVALAVLLSRATLWPQGDAAWILVLLAGAVVLWMQRREGARRRRVLRGVSIAVGVVLVLTLAAAAAVATAFHVDVRNGIGTRSYVPASSGDVHRKYELGIGRLDLDLSGVQLPRGETDVDARVGIGDLKVTVPPAVAVRVKGDAQVGAVDVFDRHADGRNAGVDLAGNGRRVLVLHVRAGLGQVTVERSVR
jgi:phage shock protein PspC (stress-responsive transcriptional regulator)/predicted membrane protein